MDDTQGVYPSTTFAWRQVKIQAPPRPQGTARAKRARMASDRERPKREGLPRKATGVLIQYRGGPEAWWEFTWAGQRYRVPGWLTLHDAMRAVFEADSWREEGRRDG